MSKITVLQAPIAKTSAFTTTPDVSIATLAGPWELHLEVLSFSADVGVAPVARFDFSDSVNAFTGSLPGPHWEVEGQVSTAAPIEKVFTSRDFAAFRVGVTSAVIRLALTAIAGANASITYKAWILSGA